MYLWEFLGFHHNHQMSQMEDLPSVFVLVTVYNFGFYFYFIIYDNRRHSKCRE